MTYPKHSKKIKDNRQAKAPYNFVSQPDEIRYVSAPPPQSFFDEKLFSGRITCTLTNSTPIYVRAAQTVNEFENKKISEEPFYYNSPSERLLIPGSSLRGMLRTLVEVISQSRLSPVTNKQLFYRSVEDTSMGRTYRDRMKDKVLAGFYHEDRSGAWISPTIAGRIARENILESFSVDSLYENERPASPKRVPHKTIQHANVYFKLHNQALENPSRFFDCSEFSLKKTGNLEEGILVITGDMNNKKKEFVFSKKTVGERIKLSDDDVLLFEDQDQLTQYQKYAFPKGKRGKGKLKDGDPVFCLLDENKKIVGFGRAFMFRLPYKSSPSEMIGQETDENRMKYDMAEALFGYVPQEKQFRQQVAGRLSISDAIMQGDIKKALLPASQLKVLSSPKPTSFQNYLVQDNPNNANELHHYDSSNQQTTLRGHKFYWHKGVVSLEKISATEQEVRQQRDQLSPKIKPIKEGQSFVFEIRFENLLPEELGAILWILDVAEDDQYRLKIGMGKPYGLGSIAIRSSVQLENRKLRYQSLFSDKTWSSPIDREKILDDARSAFAVWLLKRSDATIQDVIDTERIQELLFMLAWKTHPDPEETRYMTLPEFTGRAGNFTKRSVLPSPYGVWSKHKTK
ncbi:MAG: TIGR03986 family CRISPR-associated RAMP protein [Anaerolineales bacterium]|nr:TIGR03986 family CRISPR-associated RAMP protein [Anaerolineales bacterium]